MYPCCNQPLLQRFSFSIISTELVEGVYVSFRAEHSAL